MQHNESMRVLTLTILSLFVITTFAIAKSKQIKNLQDIPMSNSSIKEIKKHRIISSTTVSGTTEKIGDKKGVARSFNNIGYIYSRQDILKALEYYQQACLLHIRPGSQKLKAHYWIFLLHQ